MSRFGFYRHFTTKPWRCFVVCLVCLYVVQTHAHCVYAFQNMNKVYIVISNECTRFVFVSFVWSCFQQLIKCFTSISNNWSSCVSSFQSMHNGCYRYFDVLNTCFAIFQISKWTRCGLSFRTVAFNMSIFLIINGQVCPPLCKTNGQGVVISASNHAWGCGCNWFKVMHTLFYAYFKASNKLPPHPTCIPKNQTQGCVPSFETKIE